MLKELLGNITGSTTQATFTYPASYGINNVPAQATFKKFLNSLISSFGGQAGLGGMPQGFGATPQYGNTQSPYMGTPMQYFGGQTATPNKKLRAQALAPGAVVLNGSVLQPAQAFNPGSVSNQLAALNPFQGSAYQGGAPQGNPSAFFGQPGQFPISPAGLTPQKGGLQSLLMPIISIFSLIGSLFGLRKLLGSLRPIQPVDRNNLGYYSSQNSYNDFDKQVGSFDEYYPEEVETQDFGTDKLESYLESY